MGRSTERDFTVFVVEHSRALVAVAHVLTRDQRAAEDLVQSALAKAFARRRHLRGDAEARVRRIIYRERAARPGRRGPQGVPDAAGPARSGHELALGAIVQGRRLRRRRQVALGAGTAALVALIGAAYAVAARPGSKTPAQEARVAVPAVVDLPAGPADWWRTPMRLPGGRVVTGISRTGVGNGRTTVNTFKKGNLALVPGSGHYGVVRGNLREIWAAPTGRYAAVTSDHRTGEVGIVDLTRLGERETPVRWIRLKYALEPQWSPDGKAILLTQEDGFAVVDVASGRIRRHPVDRDKYLCTDYCLYTWLPGGDEVAIALTDTSMPRTESAPHGRLGVQIFSAQTGGPVRTVPVRGTPTGPDCWSPDGRHVLVQSDSFEVSQTRIAEVATGRIVATIPSGPAYLTGNDRVLALTNGAAVLYDLAGRPVERRPLPDDLEARILTLGPSAPAA